MGTVVARLEKRPLVPNTPEDPDELRIELRALSAQLNAVQTLRAYRVALNYIGTFNQKKARYFLVNYDASENRVFVSGYAAHQSEYASFAYTEAERQKSDDDNIVLVAADSISKLQKAYPNYFLDTQQFTLILWKELDPGAVELAA